MTESSSQERKKVALVTGGTRGIGEAIARDLQKDGFHVAVTYTSNEEAAREFQDETGISVFRWDVKNYQACIKGVQEVKDALGAIDILVNNAGITRDGLFHKMTFDQWDAVLRTNLDQMFTVTRCVIEEMRARSWGRIINISSINGQKGQFGQTNYSASKAGVIGFTKALAQESAAKGITVNCICPGYTETEMISGLSQSILESMLGQIPVRRFGKPEEIASVTRYLTSPEAAFITGAVFSVNGGHYMANG